MAIGRKKVIRLKRTTSDPLSVELLANFMNEHEGYIKGDSEVGLINASVPTALVEFFANLEGFYDPEDALGQLERTCWSLRNANILVKEDA